MSKKNKWFKRDGIKIKIPPIDEQLTNFRESIYTYFKSASEQLNELKKQRAMKITEKTKIKDLIPEEYELDIDSKHEFYKTKQKIRIPIRKKEVKDFKWYANKYFKDGRYRLAYQIADYDSIPFEFKIGLLKFICDDLKDDILMILTLIRAGQSNMTKTGKICPPEFLNSIFK